MKRIKLGLLSFSFFSSFLIFAQNDQDAVRYGIYKPKGTSRSQSLSGAINAMGADFSNASNNVAGLGVFRKSQTSITLDLTYSAVRTGYFNESTLGKKATPGIGNAGFLYSHRFGDEKKTKGLLFLNIYAGYNKINDFNRIVHFKGMNDASSFLEPWMNNVNQGIAGTFYEQLALETELLYQPVSNGPFVAFDAPWPQIRKYQTKFIQGRGSLGEINLAASGNISNKLFFGLGLNINTLNYNEVAEFTETEADQKVADFLSYTFREELRTKGTGYNVKLGFIYRPADFIRIGLAFHTPTWFTLTDRFSNELRVVYDNGNRPKAVSPDGFYRYKYTMPLEVQGSVAFVFGRKAFIDLEYEYNPSKSMKFREFNGTHMDLNQLIRDNFKSVHTLRLGAEYKLGMLGLRAGGFFGSSLLSPGLNNMPIWGLSGGLGLRLPSGFFLDASYQFIQNKYVYRPYVGPNSSPSDSRQQWHTPSLTLGVAF